MIKLKKYGILGRFITENMTTVVKPGEEHVPGKNICWWVVLQTAVPGFDWNKVIVDCFNNSPIITFSSGLQEVFDNFKTNNSGLISGEGTPCGCGVQYASGVSYKTFSVGGTGMVIILAKPTGEIALLMHKQIVDPAIVAPKATVPTEIMSELERLRRENEELRRVQSAKTGERSTIRLPFFLPPVSSLPKTEEVANAFAIFYGYFIVVASNKKYINSSPPTGSGFTTNTVDLDGAECTPLIINPVNTKKRMAYLLSSARILGLTKGVFHKYTNTNRLEITISGGKPYLSLANLRVILERKECDEEGHFDCESPTTVFTFQSNLPLLRFLNESIKGKHTSEMSIDWVMSLSKKQAECMLRGMAVGSTSTYDTIEVLSPLLASNVMTLCDLAGYTYECENVGDLLWIVTIKKDITVVESTVATAPFVVATEDIENPS